MPDDVLTRPPQSPVEPIPIGQEAADARDLAGFGYKQELKRVLGIYSSFAVAFSYISPAPASSRCTHSVSRPVGRSSSGPGPSLPSVS